jgi:hypothetical protein
MLVGVEDSDQGRELVRRTAVAVIVGLVIAKVPGAGPAMTALTPLGEAFASALARVNRSREDHATETLMDAIDSSPDTPREFIDKATSDDRRIELLVRTLLIAQDTALRDKRRALGRALAAGVAGDDARINEELLVSRAIADLDEYHIRLLAFLGSKLAGPGEKSGNILQRGWSPSAIDAADPGFGLNLRPVLATLELHGLIQTEQGASPFQPAGVAYNIRGLGQRLLRRLREDPASNW